MRWSERFQDSSGDLVVMNMNHCLCVSSAHLGLWSVSFLGGQFKQWLASPGVRWTQNQAPNLRQSCLGMLLVTKKGLGSLGKAKAGPGPSKKRKAPDKSKAGPGPVLPGQSLGRSRAGPGPKCKAPQKKTGQKKALAEGPSGTAYEKWQKHKTT